MLPAGVFNPTHSVPAGGMGSWEEPNPSTPSARLDAGTPVEVAEWRGAWARIVCSNGWGAWVDGRRLVEGVSAPGAPAAAGASLQSMLTPGVLISLAGAAGGVIATLLPWLSLSTGPLGGTVRRNAFKLPVEFLFSPKTSSQAGTLGVIVLLVALLAGAAVFLPQVTKYRRIAALALIAIPILYIISVTRAVSGTGRGPLSVVAIGAYLCIAAGAALLAGDAAPVLLAGANAGAPQPSSTATPPERPQPPLLVQPEPATPGWVPTHRAPAAGLRTWPAADAAAAEGPRIGGGLDVKLLERQGDWAHVECANGWRAWVDARLLEGR